MEDLLKTEDVAKALNIKGVTLRGYRVKGKGPIFVKIGRAIRYRPSDVEKYVANQVRENTSQPGGDNV